ncbi:tetratricopeptide repeat protein [Streptomyces sp. NPDC017941]|uniref:tetratricopeptide repeat protein n=1 Tax=Streptomyces sp. NPDC017941 TaxID=3365018 RepID=UPI0037ABE293
MRELRELQPEEATVYCPMCQARLEEDDRFCTDCEHDMSVRVSTPVPSGALPDDEPYRAAPPATPPPAGSPPAAAPPASELPPGVPSQPPTRNSLSDSSAGAVIQAGTITGHVTVHTTLADGRDPADSWPRVGRLRRLWFGVRPTSHFGDEPSLTPYVERDCDEELHTLVVRGLHEGGLVVVTGGPLSGKTMTAAWAALSAGTDPEPRVHAPHPGADLRDIASGGHGRDGHRILWLDDLEGHLGPRGLTAALLSRLVQEGVLVLATMRDTAYDEHRFGGGPAARVLSGARTVELSRRWSAAELARLAGAGDPRLTAAAERRGSRGVTEYLALGPELWDEWRRARRPQTHPQGHLLVRAAIDLARCGIGEDIPLAVLRAVVEDYPDEQEASVREGRRHESFEEALAWATRLRYDATGLLVPGTKADTYRAYGSLVADAVRSGELGEVSTSVWVHGSATAAAHGLDVAPLVDACRAALLPRAAGGDVEACLLLGWVAVAVGDVSEAEGWYRRAADRGNPLGCNELGHILAGRGAVVEAAGYLEKAAEAGSKDAYLTLGKLYRDRARHWLNQGAEAGDPNAAFHLAELLLRPGRMGKSARWYRAAAETGHRDAAFALNVLRVGMTLPPEQGAETPPDTDTDTDTQGQGEPV